MLEAKTYVVLLSSFNSLNKDVSGIFYGPKSNATLAWDKNVSLTPNAIRILAC